MTIRIGTLGSAATFAGEATTQLRGRDPELSEPLYFSSTDDCWNALRRGDIEALVTGAERTGQPHQCREVAAEGMFVIAEIVLPLRCNLYAKPGTRKEAIRKITGHGSLHQCTSYLEREFPGVPREVHGQNSVEAARVVAAGDGSMAVVGTQSLPSVVSGLEEIAHEIDDGAICRWWAVARAPRFAERAQTVIAAVRSGADGALGALIADVGAAGYRLASVAPFAVKEAISTYDYLLRFAGTGERAKVEVALAHHPGARLAAALA